MDTSNLIDEIMRSIEAMADGRGDWYVNDDRATVRVEGDTICIYGPEDDEGNVLVRRFRLVEVGGYYKSQEPDLLVVDNHCSECGEYERECTCGPCGDPTP